MTLKEAATILNTSSDNLRGAIRRGSLKAAKHGRDWWVDPKEVERYRRENRRRAEGSDPGHSRIWVAEGFVRDDGAPFEGAVSSGESTGEVNSGEGT